MKTNIPIVVLKRTALYLFLAVFLIPGIASTQTLNEVQALLEQKKYSEAEQILKAVIKENPEDVKAQILLGKVYKEKGQFDRAERQLSKAIDIDPTNVDGYMEIAQLILDRPRVSAENRWRRARLYYKKAIENAPASGEALLLLFESYVNTGEAEKGSKAVVDFFETNPDSLASYLAYAELIKATEHNMLKRCDQLFDFYVKALEHNPTKPKDLYNIGWGFFTTGDLDNALAVYKKGLTYDDAPSYKAFLDMMVFTYELRVYDESLTFFLKGYLTMPPEQRSMFQQVSDVPQILIEELNREFDLDPVTFLDPGVFLSPEMNGLTPDLILHKLRHYSIVWLRSKTEIKRKKPLEMSGTVTFEEPYLIHWGQYNYIDYTFHFLLDDDDKERFLLYTIPEQRETFRERYFRQKDPTPTNDKSEIRDEFYQRLEQVYEDFKILPNPAKRTQHIRDFSGFDDRGRVFLKYGEPEEYYIDFGGMKRVFNTSDRVDGGLPPLLIDNIEVGFSEYSLETDERTPLNRPFLVKPNMSWAYLNYDRHLFFDFVQLEEGYFTLVDNLDDAAPTSDMAWLLYVNRAYYGNMTGIYEDYMYQYDRGIITSPGIFLTEYLLPDLSKKDEVIANYPTNLMDMTTMAKPLLTALDFSTFKGDSAMTRLEVYTGIEYRNLQFEETAGGLPSTTLGYRIVVKDVEIKPVYVDTIQSGISLQSAQSQKEMSALHQFQFSLDPGYYQVDVHSENPEGGREGNFQIQSTVRSYAGTDLMISDIQLAARIEPANPGDPFVKNGLMVQPFPFRQIDRKVPISFYLEIYNLGQRPDGTSSFDIKYSATVIEPNQGVIDMLKSLLPGEDKRVSVSVQHSRLGSGPDFVEYLAFDFSNLIPGEVEMKVEVIDKISGKTASRIIKFRLF